MGRGSVGFNGVGANSFYSREEDNSIRMCVCLYSVCMYPFNLVPLHKNFTS